MQQQFPHAGLELVQRYEQELGRVHHLQTKATLQRATIDELGKRLDDNQLGHLENVNAVLKEISELQDRLSSVESDIGMLDRQTVVQRQLVDRMLTETSQSRLRFAHHFVQRMTTGAEGGSRRARGPKEINPSDVFGEFDAVGKAFVDDYLTTPTPDEMMSVELLMSEHTDASEAQRRASFVLLELAAKNIRAHEAFVDSAEEQGLLLPHEVITKRATVDAERKAMRGLVGQVALGRPSVEAQLSRMLGLEDVEHPSTDAVNPSVLHFCRPTSGKQCRGRDGSNLGFGPEFASPSSTPSQPATELKDCIRRFKDQIAAYELAIAAPSPTLREMAIREVDAIEFQQTRKTQEGKEVRPFITAAAVAPRPPPGGPRLAWRSNVAARPSTADRYRHAAQRCGAVGAAKGKADYDPHLAGPFKFRSHSNLEAAVHL